MSARDVVAVARDASPAMRRAALTTAGNSWKSLNGGQGLS